jgi:transcriptional regulator with XRE-family HTH domain
MSLVMGTRERAKPGPLSLAIAASINAERARKQVTQAQLAEVAGVSQQLMSDYLSGRKSPTPDQVQAMCEALGLDFLRVIADAERAARAHAS